MNPNQYQQMAMPTVEVFLAIEEQILINIGKFLSRYKNLLTKEEINQWEMMLLQDLKGLTQQNIILIAKHSGLAIDEVSKMLEEAGYQSSSRVDSSLQEAVRRGKDITPPAGSGVLESILLTYQKQAKDTFNMINTTLLKQSQQAYIDILNKTTGKVLAGTVSPQAALREAASGWAEKGIPALIDKAGKQWSTEAYVNMVTRTMSNNVTNDMQFARMEEYGVDLIEISSHLGARPLCEPYQGGIYSKSGTDKKYPPLSSTSYGEIAGIRGINCGHVFYPFFEGVSIQRPPEFTKEENDKAYKQSQQQRYLERQIRYAKRELNMMSAMGDDVGIDMAKQKVRDKQANMRAFIDDTGRTRRREREQLPVDNPVVGRGKSK
jgi:hypothetical protein